MKKYTLIIALILLVSGCGASATATPAPTLTNIPPTGTPAPQTRVLTLQNDKSVVDYDAILQIGGMKMSGTFGVRGNEIKAVPGSADGTYQLNLDVIFDGNAVTGANDLVVNALKSNLEVDKFPYGRFLGTTRDPVSLTAGTETKTVASGTLELHGQTRPFELPISITIQTDGKLYAVGTTQIDLLDYNVFVPTALMKSQIQFTAKLTAAEMVK